MGTAAFSATVNEAFPVDELLSEIERESQYLTEIPLMPRSHPLELLAEDVAALQHAIEVFRAQYIDERHDRSRILLQHEQDIGPVRTTRSPAEK